MNFNNYFIALENRFNEFENYIDISVDNYDVYSNNICLLLLSVCAEFEIVSKKMSLDLGAQGVNNINDIYNHFNGLQVLDGASVLLREKIRLEIYNLSIEPFVGWNANDSPFWWKAYNGIKHDRLNQYKKANLKALIYAFGALSIVNHYYLWHTKVPTKPKRSALLEMDRFPELFRIEGIVYHGPWFGNEVFDI